MNYRLASIYQPVVINPFWTPTNESLEIIVTSDRLEEVSGLASWSWYDWNGTLLASNTSNFTVPSLNNSVLYTSQGLGNILPQGANATDVWMHLNVTAEIDNSTVTNEQFVSI